MQRNPWLDIPASDYERHMGSPEVAQAQMLARIFGESLETYEARSVALLGATTGNGLEKVDPGITGRLTAIDINPAYLEILEERFGDRIEGLETVEADLATFEPERSAYTLVFAGLIFEYLDPVPLLGKISAALVSGGVLVSVNQMATPGMEKVTGTPFESLRLLDPVMKLVRPCQFRADACGEGMSEIDARTETLESGKSFFISVFRKD